MSVTVTFSPSDRITGRFHIWTRSTAQSGKWQLQIKTGKSAVIREADDAEKLLRKVVQLGAGRISVMLRESVERERFTELLKAAEQVQGAHLPCIRIWCRMEPPGNDPDIKKIDPFSAPEQWIWNKDSGEKLSAVEISRRKWQESFRGQLFHLVDTRGMKDSQVYKKANVDRRLYSKIRCGQRYRPGKKVVLALAIALELNLDETENLLASAGYSLCVTDLTDKIFVSFVREKRYNLNEINEMLFACRLPILGGTIHEDKE